MMLWTGFNRTSPIAVFSCDLERMPIWRRCCQSFRSRGETSACSTVSSSVVFVTRLYPVTTATRLRSWTAAFRNRVFYLTWFRSNDYGVDDTIGCYEVSSDPSRCLISWWYLQYLQQSICATNLSPAISSWGIRN